MPTPEQHAEVAIAILNHIAAEDGLGGRSRWKLGLTPEVALPSTCPGCLLCHLYEQLPKCPMPDHPTCPAQKLCRRYCATSLSTFPREAWVRAYRYHAGRAP